MYKVGDVVIREYNDERKGMIGTIKGKANSLQCYPVEVEINGECYITFWSEGNISSLSPREPDWRV